MTFNYCDKKGGRRIPASVCERNLQAGRCEKTKTGCQFKKESRLSPEERQRRADLIREIGRQTREAKETELAGRTEIGDTDI